jgi:hypothetical protein
LVDESITRPPSPPSCAAAIAGASVLMSKRLLARRKVPECHDRIMFIFRLS